jgi:hypothetical protein
VREIIDSINLIEDYIGVMLMKKKIKNELMLVFLPALALWFSVFGLTAMAQTNSDKPMNAKALTDLVVELKEVVAKNTPDEKDAKLVAEKWDRRKDLAGKTRKEVIDLLYQDVKSVITDSGVLYQIYSMFSFYKMIPDEPPAAETPKTKPAAVEQLIELTFRMHPYVGIDEELAALPGTADIEAEEERVRKVRIELFDETLEVNDKLTPDQKSFVKANYDHLIKIADKITEDTINKNFPTEQWIKEGLQKSYTGKFSLKELKGLIVYFQGTGGQQVLKYVRLTEMAEMITGNGGELNYTEADKAEHDKFVATSRGKKFIAAYLQEAIAYEESKENAIRSGNPDADGFAIYETENLNKLFNEFVAENYKK